MRRTFLGVPIPPPLADELDRFAASERARGSHARWTPLANLHLTLVFLGPTTEPQIASVAASLARLRQDPMPLQLGDPELFARAGALVLNVVTSAGLLHLQQQAQHASTAAGIQAEVRPYRPHITLARTRRGSAAPRAEMQRLAEFRAGMVSPGFTAQCVTLFESAGGQYRPLHRFAFAGA